MAQCTCGCGLEGSGRFRPGHDARLHGRIKRAKEERLNWAELSEAEAAAVKANLDKTLHGSFGMAKAAKPTTQQSAEAIAAERANRAARIFLANLPPATWTPDLDALLATLAERKAEVEATQAETPDTEESAE